MEVSEKSYVVWHRVDETPPDDLCGNDILVVVEDVETGDRHVRKTQPIVRQALNGPEITFGQGNRYRIIRWACMPEWKPNTEVVLNQSFGRFVISKACREELGISTNPADPAYISDAEIRQDWRYNKKLIAAVKKLGFLANGPGASLVIAEIPGCYSLHDIIICERNGYETLEINTEVYE